MAHMVHCSKYKQELEGLDEPPFDSDFGHKIYNNVSKKAWGEWVEHQKMLLNEYRLQPWTRESQEFLVEQMQQYFFGEGAALPKEYVPPCHYRGGSLNRRSFDFGPFDSPLAHSGPPLRMTTLLECGLGL